MPDIMISDTGKTNWLLWGLFFLSVGLHLALLMHIAGLYRPSAPVYIELDLRTISKPIQRNIPRPQEALDSRVLPDLIEDLSIPEGKLFQDEFTAGLRVEKLLPKNLHETVRLPEIPVVKGIDIATWEGDTDKPAAPQAEVEAAVEDTRVSEMAYINQVGQMISSNAERLYRKKAKKRQIQGRTVVMVVIGDTGAIATTRVAESSSHRMLDQIALKAVQHASPFPKPPKAPMTLYIPINFKLV